jgi:small subunit ribosomal protein S16
MAVKLRLARFGAKKKPIYRVVATDSVSPRDGRFLEVLGTYDPRNKEGGLNLDLEKMNNWISKGAQPTNTVRKIMKQAAKSSAA